MIQKKICYFGIVILFIGISSCHRTKNEDNNFGPQKVSILDTIKTLNSLSGTYLLNNDTLSVVYSKKALRLAQSNELTDQVIKAYHGLGKAFTLRHKDSSFYYYRCALIILNSFKNKNEAAALFLDMALLNFDASNFKDALILIDSSKYWAKVTANYQILADCYNSSGNLFMEIQDTTRAIESFKQALSIGNKYLLPKIIGDAIANLSVFEKDVRRTIISQKEAIKYLRQQSGTEEEIAKVNINIGTEQVNPDTALYYYTKALVESNARNLPFIVIAAYNNMAYSYIDKGNLEKATEVLVHKAIPLAEKNHNLDWLATLYDSYSDVQAAEGNQKDALLSLRNSIKYRNAFNSIKKEKQIRLLASIMDLNNKNETIKENESEITRKNIQTQILLLFFVVLFLTTTILIILYRGYRQKTKLKFKQQQIDSARRIIEIEETEKSRIGYELHDNLGYVIKVTEGFINSMTIKDARIKEDLTDKMKELSDTVRRISHRVNLLKDDQTPLQEIISEVINDMKYFSGIDVTFFIPDQIPEFSKELKLHICRIVQELLTNAGKYAHQARIQLDILISEDALLINYIDEGPGFNLNEVKTDGIGIGSIHERVSLLRGKVKLDSAIGFGTKWKITIPI